MKLRIGLEKLNLTKRFAPSSRTITCCWRNLLRMVSIQLERVVDEPGWLQHLPQFI